MTDAIDPKHVANAAQARALYTDTLKPDQSLADWQFAVRAARKLVGDALRGSQYLADIAGAIESNCGHTLVFRHLMAPPVSQDQFKLLCPAWSKNAEKECKRATKRAADAAAVVIAARIDHGLMKWIRQKRRPVKRDIEAVLKVVATLIAQQQMATARRSRLAFEQEFAVIRLLEADGWTKLPSKLIDTRAAVPLRHFMHKTRFATSTAAHQEVDIACGLQSTYVLAMECKVTNDETNSVKRINDVLKKATAWKEHWGNFVVTAALLQGVVAPKDVQRLTDAKVKVFWSHDLNAFRKWLRTQV